MKLVPDDVFLTPFRVSGASTATGFKKAESEPTLHVEHEDADSRAQAHPQHLQLLLRKTAQINAGKPIQMGEKYRQPNEVTMFLIT